MHNDSLQLLDKQPYSIECRNCICLANTIAGFQHVEYCLHEKRNRWDKLPEQVEEMRQIYDFEKKAKNEK